MKTLLQNLCIVLQSKPALQTPHYYGQFSLSLGKKPDISSTFNPLKMDTLLIQTFSLVHSVSIIIKGIWLYLFLLDFQFLWFFWIGLLWCLLFRYLPWTQNDWLHQQDHHLVLLAQLEKFFKKRKVVKHYVCNLSIYYNHYYLSLMTLYNLDMNID